MKPCSPKTLLATAVLAALTAETAFAQLEEVVVTAERREASLQDTPISIEALTEQDIQERGINNNLDMINEVVGVNGYGSPQGGSSTAFIIRGIGDGAPQISLDPAAGRYVDGVYIGKNQGSSPDIVDLARIEVLKGPQGTLSGRNSTSGAINYISKAPSDEMGLTLRGTAGNYGTQEYSVRADLPFSDSFRTAISFSDRQRDPFYDNTNPDVEGFNSVDRDGFRVALAWDATDRLSVDYAYSKSNVNGEQDNWNAPSGFNPTTAALNGYLAAGGDPANVPIDSTSQIATVGAIAGGVAQSVQFGLLPNIPQVQQFLGWSNDYLAWANGVLDNRDNHFGAGSGDVNSFAEVENETHTLTLNYELSDSVSIKYIYGDRTMNDRSQSDLDGIDNSVGSGVRSGLSLQTIGGALFGQVVPTSLPFCTANFSVGLCPAGQEAAFTMIPIVSDDPRDPTATPYNFQLALDMISAINANGDDGIFWTDLTNRYEQESHELQILGSTDSLDWVVGLYDWEDYGEMRNVQNATYGLASSASRGFDVGGDAQSVFGEVTWRASDKWSFTAGLRYNDETKYMTYRWRDFPAGGVAAWIGAAIGDSITNHLTITGTEAYVRSLFPAGTPEAVVQAQVDGAIAGLTMQNTPRSLTFGYVGGIENVGNIPETPGVYGNYNKQDFSNTSGRLVAKYNLDDNTNFYASYTTGYRAGGFNGGAFNRATGTGDDYTEETIASFEVGVKSTLADGRLRINGAYYSYEYDDVQVSVVKTDEGAISTDVVNAAGFSTDGLELDVTWLATDSLMFRAQYAYTDRDFDEYPAYLGLNIQPTQGLTPDNQYNVIMDWQLWSGAGSDLALQMSAAYTEETVSINSVPGNYGDGANPIPVNLQQPTNQERTLVNARLTWNTAMDDGRNLNVALWGRNITDEEYRTFGYNYGPALGYSVHQWGNPATYGVDIRLDL